MTRWIWIAVRIGIVSSAWLFTLLRSTEPIGLWWRLLVSSRRWSVSEGLDTMRIQCEVIKEWELGTVEQG